MFGITTSYSMGLPALDARKDFGRARRSRLTAHVGHCITGRLSRERRPRWLLAPAPLAAGTARLEVVTLDSIVAAVEARTDFDHRVSVARELGQSDIEAWVRHAGSSR